MLAFAAAQGDRSPLRGRKIDPANLFSVAEEFQLELADEANTDPAIGLLGRIAAFFDGLATQRPADPAPQAPPAQGSSAHPGPDAAAFAAMGKAMTEIAGSVQAFAQASAERSAQIEGQVAAIQTALEQTPAMAFAQRQPATGGDGRIRTDC
jgi:hypothetical protein